MTIKEAIEILKGYFECGSTEELEAGNMAISALEKQEEKRLSVNMIEVFDYNEGYCEKPEYHCSICGRIIVKKHNYCPKCGQRIDWSDEHGTD